LREDKPGRNLRQGEQASVLTTPNVFEQGVAHVSSVIASHRGRANARPDDRLREAIRNFSAATVWIASSHQRKLLRNFVASSSQ
jgi:hypothetical protein